MEYKGKSRVVSVFFILLVIIIFMSYTDLNKIAFSIKDNLKLEVEKTVKSEVAKTVEKEIDIQSKDIKQDQAIEIAQIDQKLKVFDEFINSQKKINDIQKENNTIFSGFNDYQKKFNSSLVSEMEINKNSTNSLLEKLKNPPTTKASDISGVQNFNNFQNLVKENGNYNVLVFFRGSRLRDSEHINEILINNGYKSASIQTSLKEVLVSEEPESGSTVIMPLTGRSVVADRIEDILSKSSEINKNNIIRWGEYDLKKGDIQIYLF